MIRLLGGVPVALVLVLSPPACGGAQSDPAGHIAQDTAFVQSRLVAGPWRLADYHPDIALEPMLQAMLALQTRTMTVRFDGRTLSALSPTLQITRPYTLENVATFTFDLVSPDAQGGGQLRSHCELSSDGRRIMFHAQTDPWTGTGTIEREGL